MFPAGALCIGMYVCSNKPIEVFYRHLCMCVRTYRTVLSRRQSGTETTWRVANFLIFNGGENSRV